MSLKKSVLCFILIKRKEMKERRKEDRKRERKKKKGRKEEREGKTKVVRRELGVLHQPVL
jgi:hypothetical protein